VLLSVGFIQAAAFKYPAFPGTGQYFCVVINMFGAASQPTSIHHAHLALVLVLEKVSEARCLFIEAPLGERISEQNELWHAELHGC
jgi:hypothetical protein